MRNKTRAAGFTLIELMISVAIVAILAATAITLFKGQQMRAKRSEAMTNIEAVAKAAKGFFGDSGVYPTDALYYPPDPFASGGVPWNSAGSTSFDVVGFHAEGTVRYRYDLIGDAGCFCAAGSHCFTTAAYADLDGNGPPGAVAYFHADSAGGACPTAFGGFIPNTRGGIDVLDETAKLDSADPY